MYISCSPPILGRLKLIFFNVITSQIIFEEKAITNKQKEDLFQLVKNICENFGFVVLELVVGSGEQHTFDETVFFSSK